jgi:predicted MPP superfamily phosphohydrolase
MRATMLRAARWLLVVAAVLVPPALGALWALRSPAHVDLAPGLSVEATARRGQSTVIDLGALGALRLPRAHTGIPVVGDVAATIRVDPVAVGTEGQTSVGLYTALLHDPADNLASPVLGALGHRALMGATAGVALDLVVGACLLLGKVLIRRWRAEVEDLRLALREHEEALARQEQPTPWDEGLQRLHHHVIEPWITTLEVRSRRFGLGMAGLTVAVGLLAVSITVVGSTTTARAGVPLGLELVGDNPFLRGATVTGSGAQVLVNQALTRAVADKRRVDAAYRTIDQHLLAALGQLGAEPALRDPRNVVLLHVSDIHCALPYYEQVLPRLVELTGTRIVVNTGDSDVSTGTLPFESQCVNALRTALTPRSAGSRVDMVAVMGNHDGPRTAARMRALKVTGTNGKKYHPITVLDDKDDARATVAGVTFVGSADPRTSVIGTPIQPNDPQEQHAVVAEQGAHLADVACESMTRTGVAPILLAHDPSAPDATLRRGCTSLALSGHTHRQSRLVTSLSATGALQVVFTQGTSSGVGEDSFTLYAEPKRDAPVTVFVWDTLTHRVTARLDIVIHPDTTVTTTPLVPVPAS